MNGSLPSVTLMKGIEADIRLIVEGFECTDVQNMLSELLYKILYFWQKGAWSRCRTNLCRILFSSLKRLPPFWEMSLPSAKVKKMKEN